MTYGPASPNDGDEHPNFTDNPEDGYDPYPVGDVGGTPAEGAPAHHSKVRTAIPEGFPVVR